MRGGNFLAAVAAEVAIAEVIGDDEDDVGFGVCLLDEGEGDEESQGDEAREGHGVTCGVKGLSRRSDRRMK